MSQDRHLGLFLLHAVIARGVALPQQAHACTKFHHCFQHNQRQLNFRAYFTPRRAIKSGGGKQNAYPMCVADAHLFEGMTFNCHSLALLIDCVPAIFNAAPKKLSCGSLLGDSLVRREVVTFFCFARELFRRGTAVLFAAGSWSP